MGWMFWKKKDRRKDLMPKLSAEDQACVDIYMAVRSIILDAQDDIGANDNEKKDLVAEILLRKYWEMQNDPGLYCVSVRAFQVCIPESISQPVLCIALYRDMLKHGINKGFISEDQAIEALTVMVEKFKKN